MKKKLNLMNLVNEQLSKKEMEELNGGLNIRIGNWSIQIKSGHLCSHTCINSDLSEGAADNNNGAV